MKTNSLLIHLEHCRHNLNRIIIAIQVSKAIIIAAISGGVFIMVARWLGWWDEHFWYGHC